MTTAAALTTEEITATVEKIAAMNLPEPVKTAMLDCGWHKGGVRVDTLGAADLGRKIHDAYGELVGALAVITPTTAKLQDRLANGNTAYDWVWVNQATEKASVAAAKLETLMGVARYSLTSEQITVAHSLADVWFMGPKD